MIRIAVNSLLSLFVLLAGGCATTPDYDPPTVNVISLRMLPSGTMTPRFAIGLHIVNPNRTPLELKGIAYTVYLEDHKILTGASNDLPVIKAYGEGEVTLYAMTNIMGSISLISDLMKSPRKKYEYRLDAKLDPGGRRPELRIVEEGSLDLDSP